MAFTGSIQDLQRSEVVDSTGDKVGKVGQVYLTNDGQEPSWVTVNTGLFGSKETFIPLAEAKYADGVITVPYEKSFIKDAPHVDEDGEISSQEEDELYRYYGVADGRDAGVVGGVDRRREEHQLRDADRDSARGDRDLAEGHDRRAEHEYREAGRHEARADNDADKVTLHEEKVNVGTERRETGKARLRKYVVTETEQVEVPVQREEVVLEREPASGNDNGRIGEDEVSVTLSEERPVISKETVATEDVSLGKRTVQDTQTVNTEVAHEEVDVDGVQTREGDKRDRI